MIKLRNQEDDIHETFKSPKFISLTVWELSQQLRIVRYRKKLPAPISLHD